MDRIKRKKQFGRQEAYEGGEGGIAQRQIRWQRRFCAAAAVLFALAVAVVLTAVVYRMDAKAQSLLQLSSVRRGASISRSGKQRQRGRSGIKIESARSGIGIFGSQPS